MPYIKLANREQTDLHIAKVAFGLSSPGDLNYAITRLCDLALENSTMSGDPIRYVSLNAIIGVLECAKLEFYRRIITPFEDKKKFVNGDVYDEGHITR